MYRRYSQVNDHAMPLSQIKRNRIKNAVILVLIAGIAALTVIAVPALQADREERVLYIRRMQSEWDEAIRQTSTLSRNGGADSASLLARIRSNLYAIRTINNLSINQGSGELISENRIVDLQNTVDRYLTFLTTGMDTGEYQTNLQNALTELQGLINSLD